MKMNQKKLMPSIIIIILASFMSCQIGWAYPEEFYSLRAKAFDERGGVVDFDRLVEQRFSGAPVVVIGSDFVGTQLVNRLGQRVEKAPEVTLFSHDPSRATHPVEESSVIGGVRSTVIQGSLLNPKLAQLIRTVDRAKVVIDTQGLSRQYPPPGQPVDMHGLLVRELLQNSMRAVLIGDFLGREQRLVSCSSSEVSDMLGRLAPEGQDALSREIDARALRYFGFIRERTSQPIAVRPDAFLMELERFVESDLQANSPAGCAEEFSYAYSCLLGERILGLIAQRQGKDIVIVRLSDVYGPGQSYGQELIDPDRPATFIQRSLGIHEAVNTDRGYNPWDLPPGDRRKHGFRLQGEEGTKTQKIEQVIPAAFGTYLAPIYIDDAAEILLRCAVVSLPGRTAVIDASTPSLFRYEVEWTAKHVIGTAPVIHAVSSDNTDRSDKPTHGQVAKLNQRNARVAENLMFLGIVPYNPVASIPQRPVYMLTPFDKGLDNQVSWHRAHDGVRYFIQNSRGKRLAFLMNIPNPADYPGKRPVLFLFHGLSGYKTQPHLEAFAQRAVRDGYIVIRPDFTNNRIGDKPNESEGPLTAFSIEQEIYDCQSILRYLREYMGHMVDLSRCIIGGHSCGGLVARRISAIAAEQRPMFEGLGITAVIDMSGIVSPSGSVTKVLERLQSQGVIADAQQAYRQWKGTDSFAPFNGQRFYIRHWETYNPLADLQSITPGIPYVYIIGTRDDGVLCAGVPGEQERVDQFLRAVAQRGKSAVLRYDMVHEYPAKLLPGIVGDVWATLEALESGLDALGEGRRVIPSSI